MYAQKCKQKSSQKTDKTINDCSRNKEKQEEIERERAKLHKYDEVRGHKYYYNPQTQQRVYEITFCLTSLKETYRNYEIKRMSGNILIFLELNFQSKNKKGDETERNLVGGV